jgi:predicted permease
MITWLARLVRRIALLVRLDRRERDMADEMRFHLDMEARDLAARGLSPDAAARAARLAFGGVERHKEDGRDAHGVRWLEDLVQDLRYAWRQAAAHPSFTLATLLTLGLGIGASTVMYTFTRLNAVPFDDADRLVYIRQYSKTGCPNCRDVAVANAFALAASARSIESVSILTGWNAPLRIGDRSEIVRVMRVTHEYFRTVALAPLLGRTFAPPDTLRGQMPVAVVSEAFWRTRLGADSGAVGRPIAVDGSRYRVVGVIPNGYEYPERTEAWVIRHATAGEMSEHGGSFNGQGIARLRTGATLAQAKSEAATVAARLALAYPAFKDWTLTVEPLRTYDGFSNDSTTAVFLTAVAVVLVIACTNLGGLLLARLTRRRRELAVRAAMGAGGSRIARQLLTETLLICIAAGLAGLAFAFLALGGLVSLLPETVAPPGWTRLDLDWRAFAFALGLGSIAGLLIGLWPSIRFARPDFNVELRDSGRSSSGGGASGGERVRRVLVVAELALSLVLVAAAGLLVRTEANIAKAPVGFSGDHVLTLAVQLPTDVDGKRVESRGYFDKLADEVARTPGVSSAGAVSALPLSRSGVMAQMFQVEGRPPLQGSGGTRIQVVTPGYFTAFKIPLLRGRALTATDVDTLPRAALVNESLARTFFPDGDAIGRVLVLFDKSRLQIVGVVGDVKQQGATNGPGQEILIPAATMTRRSMNLVVRTTRDPAELGTDVMKAIAAFDPNLAIYRVRTMDRVLYDFLAPFRVERILMGAFATIALVIATMGMYAIVSYGVAARTREFGVRLALGATDHALLTMVLGQALRLATVGVVLGIAGAIGATQLMKSLLYQVKPGDPLTIGAACAGICGVALIAALIPARRAMTVDPVTSLKVE